MRYINTDPEGPRAPGPLPGLFWSGPVTEPEDRRDVRPVAPRAAGAGAAPPSERAEREVWLRLSPELAREVAAAAQAAARTPWEEWVRGVLQAAAARRLDRSESSERSE